MRRLFVTGRRYGVDAKLAVGGWVSFARYGNGATALSVVAAESGPCETLYRASVALAHLDPPPPDQIWVKTWSENEGVLEALIDSAIVEPPTHQTEVGFGKAYLCKLTPFALEELERQMKEGD